MHHEEQSRVAGLTPSAEKRSGSAPAFHLDIIGSSPSLGKFIFELLCWVVFSVLLDWRDLASFVTNQGKGLMLG